MENKAYIANLKFGTWRNQLWFSGEDSVEGARQWNNALAMLPEAVADARNANEFLSAAEKHFEEYGFYRLQK